MIFTRSDGVQVDMSTGEIVGQAEPATVSAGAAKYPETGSEIYPESAGKTALDALQQFTWTTNAALLALPDAAIKAAGRAAGVKEEDITTLSKFFNKGQTAPKNAVERYAAAIGQGVGAGLPLTGTFGAIARTKALTGPLLPNAPITKQIAKETLDFFRTNPKAAVALDAGFGAAYGATEQLVRESTEPGQTRDVLEATVPFAATVALPVGLGKVAGLALKLSPTAYAIRKAREQLEQIGPSIIPKEDVATAVRETVPSIPLLSGPLNYLGKVYGSFAAKDISKKIGQSLDLIGENATQEQLRLTNDILKFAADNGFDGKFVFNLAEATLNPYLRQAYNDAIKGDLSTTLRKTLAVRNQERDDAFVSLITKLTPEAQLGLQDALILNAAERTKALDDVLNKMKGLDSAERDRIADQFNKADSLADIGASLRASILMGRNALISQWKTKADELTARPFGARRPLREEGQLEEDIPSLPFYSFATGFLKKYNLNASNRFFAGQVPEPAKAIANVMRQVQEVDSGQTLERVLTNLIIEKNHPYLQTKIDEREAIIKRGMTPNTLEQDATVYASKLLGVAKEGLSPPGIIRTADGKEIQTKELDVQIIAEAKKRIEGSAKEDIRISLPESIDLLANAQRFRGAMFEKAERELQYGTISSVEADQTKRFGEKVLGDVENFVFGDKKFEGFSKVPGIEDVKRVYRDSLENGFDKFFPLLATRRTLREEYTTSDTELIKKALSDRENLRSLNVLFGDNPTYAKALENAILLRARDANVISNDGILNEAAYTRFLNRNQSLINDLPDSVQRTLRDELSLSQAFANEKATLLAQKEALQDVELDKIIKEVIRPGAEVKDFVLGALSRPADMRKLVDTVGKDPEKLQALRRNVWETMVSKMLDPNDPILLSRFKTTYGKALNMLYPTPADQNNLNMIAALQERILGVARPSGDRSPFRTFEETLRKYVGAGVGTLESTARAAAIRIISPIHAGVSIMTRFLARQQQGVAERILLNALIDDKYAKEFINASASINTEKGLKQASKLAYNAGASLPFLLRIAPSALKTANIELSQALQDEEEMQPRDVAPGPIAPFQEQLAPPRALPAMPQIEPRLTRGQEYQKFILERNAPRPPAPAKNLGQSPAVGVVPPMPQAGPANYGSYQALFPNDPLAPLIQSRQPAR